MTDPSFVLKALEQWQEWCLLRGYRPLGIDGQYALIDSKTDSYLLRAEKNGHYYATRVLYGEPLSHGFRIWRLR